MNITLYRHGFDPKQLRPFSVEWSNSVANPGFSSRCNMRFDPTELPFWDVPSSRDWISVEFGGAVRFFGRIQSVSWAGAADNGVVAQEPVSIAAVGFLDLDHDLVTSTARQQRIGTMYPTKDWWLEVMKPLIETTNRNIGQTALKAFLRALYPVRVPSAAFGIDKRRDVYLGDVIAVAHDDLTASNLGIKGPCEPIQGFSLTGVRSNQRVSGKVAQILTSTFAPNPQLIELTPMLVPWSASRAGGRSSNAPPAEARLLRGTTVMALRYRMAPFRAETLKDSLRAQLGSNISAPPPLSAQLAAFDLAAYDRKTWAELPTTKLSMSDVTDINGSREASRDLTSATAWLSALTTTDDLKVSEMLGLPIIDAERAERDGLRHASTLWPFMPASKEVAQQIGSVMALTVAIAATTYQFSAPGALFQSGSIRLTRLRPEIEPGTRLVLPIAGRTLTAYITEVSHTADADPVNGGVFGSTVLKYERGLWDEADRSPPIYVFDAKLTTDEPAFSENSCEDPFADFNEGEPYTARTGPDRIAWENATPRRWDVFPPEEKLVVDIARNDWLRKWFQCRCSTSVLRGPSNLLWTPGSSTDLIGDKVPRNERGEPRASDNIWAVAAAAYVIERYWKTRFPSAQISISSVFRKDEVGTHRYGAAMDFAILYRDEAGNQRTVDAIQTWLSLQVLAMARRIPAGGTGLYLNVNPGTGLSGIDSKSAGRPSKGNRTPGGSADVHYDLRGAFGVRTSKTGASPRQNWLATDWTGNGRDEIVLGGSSYKPTLIASDATALVTGLRDAVQRNLPITDFGEVDSGDGARAFDDGRKLVKGTVTDTLRGVLANIADPEGYLNRMLGASDSPYLGAYGVPNIGNVFDNTRFSRRPVAEETIVNMMRVRRGGLRESWMELERQRTTLREAVNGIWRNVLAGKLRYIKPFVEDGISDAEKWEPTVGSRIPNIMQVFFFVPPPDRAGTPTDNGGGS